MSTETETGQVTGNKKGVERGKQLLAARLGS